MNGDKAAGSWTPWPVLPGQLELDAPEPKITEQGSDQEGNGRETVGGTD